jgi:hypothetical protein
MNYNIRPVPKLIDPSLLTRINKVYVGKGNENNFFLEWLYKKIMPLFRDNFFFTLVVLSLMIYLIYIYIENIKKKNRIIKNINEQKPIEVKLDKPINYEKKETFENETEEVLSDVSGLSKLSQENQIVKEDVFEKDLERDLQMGNNNHTLNDLAPELLRNELLIQNPNKYGNGLQQNTQTPNVNNKCSNFKIPSLNEPLALNSFSDNYEEF